MIWLILHVSTVSHLLLVAHKLALRVPQTHIITGCREATARVIEATVAIYIHILHRVHIRIIAALTIIRILILLIIILAIVLVIILVIVLVIVLIVVLIIVLALVHIVIKHLSIVC